VDGSQQLMFALQSPVGLRFGATIQVDADRITFEMDLKIPKGTQCMFRMELAGEEDTIMGQIRIDKALPARGAGPARYVGKILEMPMSDRDRFDGWRRDLATGGVSRRLERDPEQLRTQISSTMMGGATEVESRAVLERMNAKRSSRRKEEGFVEGDPLGLTDEETAEAASAKAVLREKLRAEKPLEVETPLMREKAVEQVVSEQVSKVVDSMSVPVAEAPSWLPSSSEQPVTPDDASSGRLTPTRAPTPTPTPTQVSTSVISGTGVDVASPPMVVVDDTVQPIEITMIYLSQESFVQDYDSTLHTSAVTIAHPSLTELYHSVQITLQLANGEAIDVMGQMVALVPSGMAIALELDSAQRAKLQAAAGR